MAPIMHDDHKDAPAQRYSNPAGDAALVVESAPFAGRLCPVAQPRLDRPEPSAPADLLILLDGTRLIRRIGRLAEQGAVDLARLPRIVGVDPDDPLNDYTPWWHPAFMKDAPDFGGDADRFLDEVLLPLADEAAQGVSGRVVLMGYSLAGLLCLHTLTRSDRFSDYLIASPSTWYPEFVKRFALLPVVGSPRVTVTCGRDEGGEHPEPLRSMRAETDRALAALREKLPVAPCLLLDDLDHHRGLSTRVEALLAQL